MKHEIWNVAFREKMGERTILDDTKRPFYVIPNTWRYWCGDPHIFKYNGKDYIFAELYDRVLRRGVIGYCKIENGSATSWEVALKMPYHLSYPHIFERNGNVYMIPESYVGEEIGLYIAEQFPCKWKKLKTIKSDYVAVDSTCFTHNGTTWMMTLQFENNHEILQLFFEEKNQLKHCTMVAEDDFNKRPAGKMFEWAGKMIRPAQDCTNGYGCAINFYEVSKVEVDKYEEQLIRKIKPEEVESNFKGIPEGIHTYNQNQSYEVIDLKSFEIDWLFYIMRPIWFIWRRIRKVFK